MKTYFIYSRSEEIRKFVITLTSIFTNRYKTAGFFVLPYKVQGNKKVVYLPKIQNLDIESARRIILNNLDKTIEESEEKQKLAEFINRSLILPQINKSKIFKKERKWRAIEEYLWDAIIDLLPQFREYRCELFIHWTTIGSICSYRYLKQTNKSIKITLLPRDDADIEDFLEGILSSLLTSYFKKNNFSWVEKEKTIDLLLKKTKLSRFARDFVPTISSKKRINRITEKYLKESHRYLKELGIFDKEDISYIGNYLRINGKIPQVKFTESEIKVLKMLIENRGHVVSYYDLGSALWNNNLDKFSLWALARLIYKIRFKLEKAGFPSYKLQNSRGKGYILIT